MKILIGSLLFATAILINFPELNSSPQPSSGAGPSHVNYDMDRTEQEEEVPSKVYINLFGQKIVVKLEKVDNKYIAIGCKVQNPIFRIPTRKSRRSLNYMTLADFKRIKRGNIVRIVIYVREDESGVRSLLGAKLPPPPGIDLYPTGDPRNLNPDANTWFITYEGVDYEVEVEPFSQIHIDIKLYGREENLRPNLQMIMQHWHHYPVIKFVGLYFFVFKDSHNVVQGAALDPFWNYRPGEEFQYQNPHINPQIRPQKNHPIEHNSEPQQAHDQQYHFAAHHNAYQQPNLHQNPYPYGLQVPDPNQIPYYPHLDSSQHYLPQGGFPTFHGQHYPQQGGAYPPENFDPSRDRPQQDGYQTPRFHFNPNWNFPPHPPRSP